MTMLTSPFITLSISFLLRLAQWLDLSLAFEVRACTSLPQNRQKPQPYNLVTRDFLIITCHSLYLTEDKVQNFVTLFRSINIPVTPPVADLRYSDNGLDNAATSQPQPRLA